MPEKGHQGYVEQYDSDSDIEGKQLASAESFSLLADEEAANVPGSRNVFADRTSTTRSFPASRRGFLALVATGMLAAVICSSLITLKRPVSQPIVTPDVSQPVVTPDVERARERTPPRLLESPRLARLVVQHASIFHREHGDAEASERRLDGASRADKVATDEDTEIALQLLADFVGNVTVVDPEAGRLLGEARLSTQQWAHTEHLMRALHDDRVRDVGLDALVAVDGSAGEASDGDVQERMSDRLAARSGEIRRLRDEFVPAPLRDAVPANHWRTMLTPGAVEAFRNVGGWHAALYVSRESRRLAVDSVSRRLGFLGMAKYAFILMVVGLILPIVTLVMTIISPEDRQKLWWALQGVGSGTICAASAFVQHHANMAGQPQPFAEPQTLAPLATVAPVATMAPLATVATSTIAPYTYTVPATLAPTTTSTAVCMPPQLENAMSSVAAAQAVPVYSVVWYDCIDGFSTSVGSHFGAECQADGTLMPLQPAAAIALAAGCLIPAVVSTTPSAATTCGVPPVLEHAVNGFPGPTVEVEFGQLAWFVCDDGYTTDSGVDFGAHCKNDGTFSSMELGSVAASGCHLKPVVAESVVDCGVAPVITNAVNGMPGANIPIGFGELVWYDCDPGYSTDAGVDFGATCQEDGTFTEMVGACTASNISPGNGERRLQDSDDGGTTLPLWIAGCGANVLLFGLEAIWTFKHE